jgi:predicted metalloprotease
VTSGRRIFGGLAAATVMGLVVACTGVSEEGGSGSNGSTDEPSHSAPVSQEPSVLTSSPVDQESSVSTSAPVTLEPSASVAATPSSSSSVTTQQQSQELPQTQGARGSGVDPNSMDYTAVEQYLAWVITDADKVWSTWMTGRGYQEPYVQYFLIEPGKSVTTYTCKVPDSRTNPITYTLTVDSQFPNAFYCGSEPNGTDKGVILLPVETMAKTWTGDIIGTRVSDPTKVGDFAAATVVSHEFGHNIADELSEQTGIAVPEGKNNELLADCFAGVWTTALYNEGGLEDGDIDEALAALHALADKVPNGKFPHGSAEERDNAFRIGIYGLQSDPRGGVPRNCISAFWPNFTGAT